MTDAFGVYLHVPFCRHKCDYCAFATWTDRTELASRYLAACARQIRETVDASLGDGVPPVTSVFVGGGTPTLVAPDELLAVLAEIPLAPGAEVTIESNPDDLTPALAEAYAAGGVNRLSMGVQSMVPSVLASLGRTHNPDNVLRAVEAARAADLPFNLDLIYGAAGESMEDWSTTLDAAIALEPAHISAYALTVEAGTGLAADASRHPDDDDQADKYQLATTRLEAAGMEWYEISNWARPGHECRHNQLYWQGGEYLAIGCAAHGYRNNSRFWNLRTPERYVEAVEAGRSPEAGSEELDPVAAQTERWQLQLRTLEGVPVRAFADEDLDAMAPLLVVDRDAERVRLSVEGRLLANEVALRLR